MEVLEAAGEPLARIASGEGPIVCVALHAGHEIRRELASCIALSDDDRLREEDPYTALFAVAGATLVEVVRSRFEVDLNRTRDECVYRHPRDAWGLTVYAADTPVSAHERSRQVHDVFYERMARLLDRACAGGRRFVVFDLHSYNHRRDGADGPAAPASDNPQVNLGTRSIDRAVWGDVIEAFSAGISGHGIDVRENVKFGGGAFARWVNERYGVRGCALAIEYKKTFMDEWSGTLDDAAVLRLATATRDAGREVSRVLSVRTGDAP